VSRAIQRRRWEEVETFCARFLKSRPRSVEAHYARAIAALQHADFAAARQYAAAGLAADPDSGDCAELLAIVFAAAGCSTEAARHATLAATGKSSPALRSLLPPDFPVLRQQLGSIATKPFLLRGQRAMVGAEWRTAEHWLRQHLAFEPSCRQGLLALAIALIADERHREAAAVLRATRHEHPHDPEIASTLARVLAALGKPAEAAACHRVALALDPTDPTLAANALLDQLREYSDEGIDVPQPCQSSTGGMLSAGSVSRL
jgi:Flp pilus assembly protein TadD